MGILLRLWKDTIEEAAEAYQNKRKEILEQLIISKRQTVKKWVELNLPIFYFAIIFVKKIERSVDYKR